MHVRTRSKGRIIRVYFWIICEYIDVLFSFSNDTNSTINMYIGNICTYFKKPISYNLFYPFGMKNQNIFVRIHRLAVY
jgi:hypothetical protein